MIDLREIRETIEEIKRSGSTVSQAERLALLYIAADHMEKEEAKRLNPEIVESGYSQAAASEPIVVSAEHKSDFLAACDGVRVEDLLEVMDEHMNAILMLYPKEYEMIVGKIKKTHI